MSPSDEAHALIREAERASNAFDLEALVAPYASTAVLDVVLDGVRQVHVGRDAIERAWAGCAAGMRSQRLRLRKELLAAEEQTIVNSWSGRLGTAHEACGMELWRLDDQRRVVEHRMWSYFDVRDVSSLRGRLRLLSAYPLMALDLLRRTASPA
jgi:hypothetical protein